MFNEANAMQEAREIPTREIRKSFPPRSGGR